MDVDLRVERTLVVKHVLDIGDVKTPRSDICADEDCGHGVVAPVLSLLTQLNWFVLYLLHGRLESIEILQTLSLLHLGMKAVILDFQEV